MLYHDLTELTADTTRLHIERSKTVDGSNVKADLAAIARVDPVDETTAIFEMTAPFSPLLRVLGDRAGMLLAPSAFDRINTPNSRERPVGTGAFTYVDEDLDGPYAQEYFPEYWQDGAPRVERLTMSQSIEPTQQVNGLLTGSSTSSPRSRRRTSRGLRTPASRSVSAKRTRWASSTSIPTWSPGQHPPAPGAQPRNRPRQVC